MHPLDSESTLAFHTAVIISSDAEWRALSSELRLAADALESSPYGQWFVPTPGMIPGVDDRTVFLHGGWGKIDAAASAQWAVLTWKPKLVVNLGTAGGFPGRVVEGDVVFVTRTVVYDIVERMTDREEAIQSYISDLASGPPASIADAVIASPIVSADQDIDPARVHELMQRYDAVAADWESASIARVCAKNAVPLVILREISDIVSPNGSRMYGNIADFEAQARRAFRRLLVLLARLDGRPDALAP